MYFITHHETFYLECSQWEYNETMLRTCKILVDPRVLTNKDKVQDSNCEQSTKLDSITLFKLLPRGIILKTQQSNRIPAASQSLQN